jgi:hypothetical protein
MNAPLQALQLRTQHRVVDQPRTAGEQPRERTQEVLARRALARAVLDPVAPPLDGMKTTAEPVALNNFDAVAAAQRGELKIC